MTMLSAASSCIEHQEHLDGHSHEGPAGGADVAPIATGTHVVIVREVDVKHQLPLLRRKRACTRSDCCAVLQVHVQLLWQT